MQFYGYAAGLYWHQRWCSSNVFQRIFGKRGITCKFLNWCVLHKRIMWRFNWNQNETRELCASSRHDSSVSSLIPVQWGKYIQMDIYKWEKWIFISERNLSGFACNKWIESVVNGKSSVRESSQLKDSMLWDGKNFCIIQRLFGCTGQFWESFIARTWRDLNHSTGVDGENERDKY